MLLVSPAVSSLINGYDVIIYLSIGYFFLVLLLFQYRRLCREWLRWIENIPKLTEQDIMDWYSARKEKQDLSDDTSESSVMIHSGESPKMVKHTALEAFRKALRHRRSIANVKDKILSQDPLLQRVDDGLPYVEWLLCNKSLREERTEVFSVSWFAQLNQALKAQQQMIQGLNEHSIFMLSRYATRDVRTGSLRHPRLHSES